MAKNIHLLRPPKNKVGLKGADAYVFHPIRIQQGFSDGRSYPDQM
jgi:hypothetical protein